METVKSEFDRPIALYHTLLAFIAANGYEPRFNELFKAAGYQGNGYMLMDIEKLVEWGWIDPEFGHGKGITPRRPTESIFYVERPIQEVAS